MTSTMKISDGELTYQIQGQGEPLLLLHCGNCDSRAWQLQLPALSARFKVITYDQRGAGQSSIPEQPFSPIEDLRQLLDGLSLPQVKMLGHSMGAQIALGFAAAYPGRVQKQVLLSPGLDGYGWSAEYQAWTGGLMADPQPTVIAKKILGSEMCSAVRKQPARAAALETIVAENIQKMMAWKTSDVRWPMPSTAQSLAKITSPSLLLGGADDLPDFRKILKILEEGLPAAQAEVFKDADHMVNYERPEAFNTAVLGFLV